ncbi:curlin [Sphingomonas sp. IC-56]|uniref:CsgG/HfaB family protein n=1 Tax=Sphingomonas sp. IC-56 TaxID=2898529 RepID=UPI001E4C4182|nr:CsgG/HfaB family protein [Sphingomonas sp. IC-56]MCD2324433.1 curlin [Sphingomonas sp. IC-56]
MGMFKNAILAGVGACALTGCTAPKMTEAFSGPATLARVTEVQRDLIYLPPPPAPVAIAVYGFNDQTGQLKPSENLQSLSRAVTQGATSMLVQALRDAGNGNWFTVVERERLDNILKERQIIREMRGRYLGEEQTPTSVLPSLLFAGILLEGGIIGYDTNVETGGIGARMLAIGSSAQYRTNTVTVYLRAISVKTGEVLSNVVTHKTVASVALNSNVFKFVTFDELLEFEAGVSSNEPTTIAVQAAIEKAVYALVMEGAKPGQRQLWNFNDKTAGELLLAKYSDEKRRIMAATYAKHDGPHGGALPAYDPKGKGAKRRAQASKRASGTPKPAVPVSTSQMAPMPAQNAPVQQVAARPAPTLPIKPQRPQAAPVPASGAATSTAKPASAPALVPARSTNSPN